MGKGINPARAGTNIAFTAGTGCLVFMDLVAYLIRLNLGINDKEEMVDKSFKFIFYASFPKEADSIGVDMCRGLEELCNKKGVKNFEFHVRFSD